MLIDGHNRKVNYLRISVTQRCNFRCQYCMPTTPFEFVPKENLLSFEDLFAFVKTSIDCGIDKIRITGGEPLVRRDIDKFIKMINDYKPDIDLAMTTNAYMLKNVAQRLKDAGLKRINVSLDTLKPEVAIKISQKDILKNVLEGIEEALKVGLKVKANCVVLKDINEDEVVDLIDFCKERNIKIRFIEFMENTHAAKDLKGLLGYEIIAKVKEKYKVKEIGREKNAPAFYFELEDGYQFGLIDPHNDNFCEDCNRVRLTAEGDLIPCLYFEDSQNIKEAAKNRDHKAMQYILRDTLKNKPEKNKWAYAESETKEHETSDRAFYETGG